MVKVRVYATALAASAMLAGGCAVDRDSGNENAGQEAATAQAAPVTPAPAPAPPDMSIEVNLAKRQLSVIRDGKVVETHPVAVGSEKWPTPTGEWTIGQVIINPRWIPPEEEWAEGEDVAEPGASDNPLGVVQLVYRPPNSIHGTDRLSSLGKAVSHGSIRIANKDGVALAKQVLKSGGAKEDAAWVENALAHPDERKEAAVPNPVPIRVISGTGSK